MSIQGTGLNLRSRGELARAKGCSYVRAENDLSLCKERSFLNLAPEACDASISGN